LIKVIFYDELVDNIVILNIMKIDHSLPWQFSK